jgi:FAD/FMN-containing dehydrogenase
MDLKEKLIGIVGAANFFDSSEDLARYSRDYSLEPPGRPTCIVKPGNTEEISRIIKLANDSRTPVIPCSSRVHFYGNTIPKQGGIVVDLERMNKILEVDERNRKVRIESGVTWKQVEDELEKRELRVITPLLPHPAGSVVTDWLEREVPIIPIYEYGELLEGTEVVWPNGDIFRTGAASAPGYPNSESKGANFEGPGIDFLYLLKGAQGTMGIVTWANVKVEYLPKVNKTFFSLFNSLEEAVKPVYRIERLRIGQECFLINSLNLAAILAEGRKDEFDRLRTTLSPWTLMLILSGSRRRPEERVDYEERALMKLKREEFPKMILSTGLPGVPGAGRKLVTMLRKPRADEIYWKHFYKGACEEFFFITKPDYAQGFLNLVEEVAARHGYSLSDIGCYLQPIEQSRACHLEFDFYYDPGDSKEVEKIKGLKSEAAKLLLEKGAFFTRPYGELAGLVYSKTASYTATLKKVKSIFDPNNIMNPGNLCF